MLNFMVTVMVLSGLALAGYGMEKRKIWLTAAGLLFGIGVVITIWLMGLYADFLWFSSLDYDARFWKEFWAKVIIAAGSGIISAVIVKLLTPGATNQPFWIRWSPSFLALVFGMLWGNANWDVLLRYVSGVSTGLSDPIYAKDVGFYLFSLPFYDKILGSALVLSGLSLAYTIARLIFYLDLEKKEILFRNELSKEKGDQPSPARIYANLSVFLAAIASVFFLKRYHLMYSATGAVTGPGWTDVHIRLWAYVGMAALTLLCLALLLIPAVRQRIRRLGNSGSEGIRRYFPILGGTAAVIVIGYIFSLFVLPGIVQRFRVEPNEITFERPYIEHNIRFTRSGFNFQDVEERQFPVSGEFTRETKARNEALFSNIRLWDWRALDAVYKQFQEIRLYYEFQDVDIDRYHINGEYRQVMVSARELNLANLPAKSRTFVNERFKYTHGYGITLTNVNAFTPEGLPDLLIRDIPPVSRYEALNVSEPRIYYGESTGSHVIVNSREKEFDYPSGRQNIYNRYSGSGGVVLKNIWRKLIYSWKFDGIRLLLSEYPTKESRILFRREIRERVETLAPFLTLDQDPYIVLDQGRLYWILDAYTTSARYPYSEPFKPERAVGNMGWQRSETNGLSRFYGANYVRNSVKCVIDAYNGSVDLYVFDPKDPLIRVWQKIFPDLFKSRDQMPDSLAAHVRYPSDMLLLQGLVYAKYHMTDPQVFYNQEDLWVRATEKYYNQVVPVEPYYVLWKPPGVNRPEFSVILPFTPKNRQVSIGWIAGLCDPGNYGRLIAYQFPKERRVLGPQQVETKIDQDRFLSGQLTLWDQRGSNVIRGNVLAIPVEDTIFYVEPIYLQAETAAYPELRLVAVMHGDTLSYAQSFKDALEGLFRKEEGGRTGQADQREGFLPQTGQRQQGRSFNQMADNANTAFNTFLDALGDRKYEKAAQALRQLETHLKALGGKEK